MDNYRVKMSPQAFRDLDQIYAYIAGHLLEPLIAENLENEIRTAILSLDEMPYRGAERRICRFAGMGYRRLFVKNYTIVYRIREEEKEVVIVTVRYSPSDF
ncbi:MAG: type II toxin-antitoxin system RelE/ParE family toxin [Oscillospiraceae bacterium]|nr:type II toxin-antitoxin system RelE/ParE family toxin [Oscillospiraceae bacterium]MBR6426144.1 type II toxin-antitoxin system RelE/ParE family toxin [Oscillospiraceae bacterium]